MAGEGLFSKLKSLVIEEERPAEVPAIQAVVSTTPMAFTAAAVGGVNPEMLGILTEAIDAQKNTYTTFKETTGKIAGVIADEATRYKTAMATIGATKEDLLRCVDGCLPVLDLQKQQFHNNMASTLGTDIQNLEMDLAELDKTIADLNQKLSTATETRLMKEKAKHDTEAELQGFTRDFEATLAKVSSDLDVERKKLEIYL